LASNGTPRIHSWGKVGGGPEGRTTIHKKSRTITPWMIARLKDAWRSKFYLLSILLAVLAFLRMFHISVMLKDRIATRGISKPVATVSFTSFVNDSNSPASIRTTDGITPFFMIYPFLFVYKLIF
jgi:hypothetical protein